MNERETNGKEIQQASSNGHRPISRTLAFGPTKYEAHNERNEK